ncbi:hypothetical protein SNOG_14347 [Parastagonospora nodorum SN15]|uniref:Uncharacterized protein n=2 Tax=Phaeosphaeria nodorum (strain SN15 / ATCC MYA-4574 / FGSC 10173) TaxID=321614 RepID=A0A7U2I2K0_PHANO|nr:hypothetical protein SNOG_14347 [Parastagonospora nodorum SN15]EAT78218.1 hypothetical protein SNOG_14347 [Parastagonospora nodorum SN15]QRC99433.1 hypothetical protein JI435_143470 [Parastagonospora nodorum SN15]
MSQMEHNIGRGFDRRLVLADYNCHMHGPALSWLAHEHAARGEA